MSDIVPLVGMRYVFFKTLPSDSPMRMTGDIILNSIRFKLNQKISNETVFDEQLNNMQKYINFVKEMADSARANELAFLKQQLSALDKLDGENNELRDWFKQFEQGQIDYDKIFLIFNGLLQDSKYDQIILDRVRANADAVTKNFTRLPEYMREFLEHAYDTNMEEFKAVLNKEQQKFSYDHMKDYVKSYSNVFANKIQSILKQISGSNMEFKNRLIEAYNNSEKLDISDEEFKRIVVNYVVDTALNEGALDNRDTGKLADKISKEIQLNFQNLSKEFGSQDYIYAFDKMGTTLEEYALTGTGSVGDFVSQLDVNSLRRIKSKYARGDKNLQNDIDELARLAKASSIKDQTFKNLQSKVTRQLKERIRKKWDITENISKSTFKTEFSNIPGLITPTRTRSSILDSIKNVSISHDSLAEAIASDDVQRKLAKVVRNAITGPTIKFKADIRFSTGYIDSNIDSIIDENKLAEIVDNTITKYADAFFIKYQAKSHGQTDIKLAMDAYQEWISDMQNYIDKIIDKDDTITNKIQAKVDVYEALQNTFSTSISVKDYDLYNNELGTHGGSLGSKTAPEQVMKNVYKMYSLGGITALDVNQLMTAVINCGSDMLGSDMKEPLQTYLLGGAALIMFDDSFALSNEFLKSMTTKLKGQSVVNIYRINTRYIPSSYILNEIYNNLVQIYTNVNAENKLLDKRNKVNIVNDVSSQIVNNFSDQTPEEQWISVRNYTENHILIQFSFMGGLLDILERLPQAFSI